MKSNLGNDISSSIAAKTDAKILKFLLGFDENFNDCGSTDYELMTIDTIINGKVINRFLQFLDHWTSKIVFSFKCFGNNLH